MNISDNLLALYNSKGMLGLYSSIERNKLLSQRDIRFSLNKPNQNAQTKELHLLLEPKFAQFLDSLFKALSKVTEGVSNIGINMRTKPEEEDDIATSVRIPKKFLPKVKELAKEFEDFAKTSQSFVLKYEQDFMIFLQDFFKEVGGLINETIKEDGNIKLNFITGNTETQDKKPSQKGYKINKSQHRKRGLMKF